MDNRQNVVECAAFHDTFRTVSDTRMSALIAGFLEYAQYELNFSPRSVFKYKDCLGWFIRDIGDKDIDDLTVQDFVRLKRLMMERGVGQSRISSVVFATKSFLTLIRPPRVNR